METLSILVMNWRDVRNPDAGGAEIFTHEVTRRWVAKGHEVTLLTSRFRGSDPEEVLEGVQIVRGGNRFTVYRHAKGVYLDRFRERVDVVVDEINTVPFGTPRYVNRKSTLFALIHQLAREFWSYETPFPASIVGRYLLEDHWLFPYRDVPTFTVSESTRQDLVALGFTKVAVVPEGSSIVPRLELPQKEELPTLIFVGRLRKVKLPFDALEAFSIVRQRLPEARLWIVGDGYLRESLEKKAPAGVTFFGKVSHEEKTDLLSRSHVLLYPAIREGWGLSVIEANSVGTPAVGYDVPGVRDSIRKGATGLLAEPGSPRRLAESALSLLTNPEAYSEVSRNALGWAGTFDWDITAQTMLAAF